VHATRDTDIPGRLIGQLLTVELISSNIRTRVSSKTCDALNSLTEKTTIDTSDSHVAVVKLFAFERDVESKADARDEVLFRISVKHQAVNDLDRLGTRVKVKAKNKWQPGVVTRLVSCRVLSVDCDESSC
jgi:hypothetical protein